MQYRTETSYVLESQDRKEIFALVFEISISHHITRERYLISKITHDEDSTAMWSVKLQKLEHSLHKPVAYLQGIHNQHQN